MQRPGITRLQGDTAHYKLCWSGRSATRWRPPQLRPELSENEAPRCGGSSEDLLTTWLLQVKEWEVCENCGFAGQRAYKRDERREEVSRPRSAEAERSGRTLAVRRWEGRGAAQTPAMRPGSYLVLTGAGGEDSYGADLSRRECLRGTDRGWAIAQIHRSEQTESAWRGGCCNTIGIGGGCEGGHGDSDERCAPLFLFYAYRVGA
ncbi:hypothetical protein NDU88_002307 [Pleurodeles waltl]|uniref:Uncharacterized protein n=1 Tax=Pleurodeles waltl TaxID=8319 RepID=A0AAV7M169_PLEWA|nr:hypothetical protein NDU88_002307 [Pleurodeles waltl]